MDKASIHLMDQFSTLRELEKFYHSIHPAQENNEDSFVWIPGIPHPFFNVVGHLNEPEPAKKIDSLVEQFPNIPFSVWAHSQNHAPHLEEILLQKRFQQLITCPLMAWMVKPCSNPPLDIRLNDDVFHDLIARVYQFEEPVRKDFQKLMRKAPSQCENFILYQAGEPCSTASFFVDGEVGAIFNDAALPGSSDAGRVLTEFMMHLAYEINLSKLIVLSSPNGEKTYTELGFKNLFNIDFYSLMD